MPKPPSEGRIRQRLRAALAQLPFVPGALSLVWTAARRWTVAWAVLLVAQGALPVVMVNLTRALVDSLAELWRTRGTTPGANDALLWGALMVLTLLADDLFRHLAGWVRAVQGELVQDHVAGLIHAKALSLDLAFFDTPEYYDRLHRARVDAVTRPVALLESLGGLAQNGITLAAMAVVLLRFGWVLPVALAASTVPALVVTLRYALRFHDWRERNTAALRRTQYYDFLMTQPHAAAELRLFELGPHFESSFQELRLRLRTELAELKRCEAVASVAASSVGLAVMAGGVAWMAQLMVRGVLTAGELALFVQAFGQGQRMMRALLGSAGELYRNIAFLQNLFEFLALTSQIELPPAGAAEPLSLERELRLQNVSFRYPGSERLALDGFELTLPAGRIVAIVGENGAGKSTLLKLLCRFYDPEQGQVLLDGVDLRELSLPALRRQITVMFQEPVRHHDTVARNIAFGDLAGDPGPSAIETAAQAAGADVPISRLPHGYETLLGRWFGGSELSVGEWQRLALARAFLRRASLIVLDEPTAAMDSWAEADWLARFRSLAAGRTALVITHRFTTALQADLIHVMQRGKVVESGTHAELLARGGLYAASWQAQMREADAGAGR